MNTNFDMKHYNRAAVFDITCTERKTTAIQGKKVVSSTVISETQAAGHSPSTAVLPCQLNWAATWPGVRVRQ